MSADLGVVAIFERRYTLDTLVDGQGSVTMDSDLNDYGEGSEVELLATASNGYRFTGWTGSVVSAQNPLRIVMDRHHVITAKFSPVLPVRVLVSGQGSVVRNPEGNDYLVGSTVELTAVPNAGWRFLAWSGDVHTVANPLELTVDSAKELIATFVRVYPLTVTATGEGTVEKSPDLEAYPNGSEVVLTAIPVEGWAFAGWQDGGDENPRSVVMTEAKSMTALFERAYTLETSAPAGGSIRVLPRAPAYAEGATVTLTATANAGFRFAAWGGDLSGTTNPMVITMDEDKSITAEFVAQGKLSALSEGSGSVRVSPEKEDYDDGETVVLTAVPEAGWRFLEWRGALSGTVNPQNLVIEGEQSVTAVFIRVFELTTSVIGQGTVGVSPVQPVYDEGTEVILTALPSEGHSFVRWELDGTGTTASLRVKMEKDTRVRAVFASITAGEGYEAWAAENFSESELANEVISGPGGDPDGDGFTNWYEYSLGLKAKIFDREGAGVAVRGSGEVVLLAYDVPNDRDDVEYRLELSYDLEHWIWQGEAGEDALEEIGREPSERMAGERITWRLDATQVRPETKLYVRLRAMKR